MSSWGFNTIGNWSDREIYLKHKTPYVLTAYTKKTGEISDPFLPGYQEDLLESPGSKTVKNLLIPGASAFLLITN